MHRRRVVAKHRPDVKTAVVLAERRHRRVATEAPPVGDLWLLGGSSVDVDARSVAAGARVSTVPSKVYRYFIFCFIVGLRAKQRL